MSMDPLMKLFGSQARVKLLRLFLFNETESYSLGQVAHRAKVSKDAARRELNLLVNIKLLKKKKGKGRDGTLFSVNQKFVHYESLRAFFRTSTKVSDAHINNKLKRAGSMRLIALTGSFTGVPEPKVDLLVVGDRLEDRALNAVVHELEAELGRELRYAAFTTEEFRYRISVYDRLLRDVFEYPHRFVLDKIGM